MITKEQAVEILEKALANPRYLAKRVVVEDQTTNYFCSSVLMVLLESNSMTFEEAEGVSEYIGNTYIYPSINDCLFLKTHLASQGIISFSVGYKDDEYKTAARKHWATLIESLKASSDLFGTLNSCYCDLVHTTCSYCKSCNGV